MKKVINRVVFFVILQSFVFSLCAQENEVADKNDAKKASGLKVNLTEALKEKITAYKLGIDSVRNINDAKTDSVKVINCSPLSSDKQLLLVDGVKVSSTDFARLKPENIESFSALDSTVLKMYGENEYKEGFSIVTVSAKSK